MLGVSFCHHRVFRELFLSVGGQRFLRSSEEVELSFSYGSYY